MRHNSDDINSELSRLYRNQVQIITSIIDMQLDFFKKNNNTDTKNSIQNRVNSIVLLHNDLLNNNYPFYVDVKVYLNQLIRQLKFFKSNEFCKTESAPIHSSHVLTFGLIVVEIVEYLKNRQYQSESLNITGVKQQENYKIIVKSVNGLLQAKREEDVLRVKYLLGLCKQIKAEIIEQEVTIENGNIEIIIKLPIQINSYGD